MYDADDLSVVKCLVQLALTVSRHHSSAVELCRDIARDLHISVGDIDQVNAAAGGARDEDEMYFSITSSFCHS